MMTNDNWINKNTENLHHNQRNSLRSHISPSYFTQWKVTEHTNTFRNKFKRQEEKLKVQPKISRNRRRLKFVSSHFPASIVCILLPLSKTEYPVSMLQIEKWEIFRSLKAALFYVKLQKFSSSPMFWSKFKRDFFLLSWK